MAENKAEVIAAIAMMLVATAGIIWIRYLFGEPQAVWLVELITHR